MNNMKKITYFCHMNDEIKQLPRSVRDLIRNYQNMLQNFVNYQMNQFVQQVVQINDVGKEMVNHLNGGIDQDHRLGKDSGMSSHDQQDENWCTSTKSIPEYNENCNDRVSDVRKKLDELQFNNTLPGLDNNHNTYPETDIEMKWKEIHAENLKTNGSGGTFECAFCKKNGELPIVYRSHSTKDDGGIVTCPILQEFICEMCGATGEQAHTKKYCPMNPQQRAKRPPLRVLANGVVVKNRHHK